MNARLTEKTGEFEMSHSYRQLDRVETRVVYVRSLSRRVDLPRIPQITKFIKVKRLGDPYHLQIRTLECFFIKEIAC